MQGGGGPDEDAARGRVWIFSGITQCCHIYSDATS